MSQYKWNAFEIGHEIIINFNLIVFAEILICVFDIDVFVFFPRSASLAHVNAMLREQLDQATAANQSLTSDIHKLTQDWQAAREELDIKEREWRDEEQVNVAMTAGWKTRFSHVTWCFKFPDERVNGLMNFLMKG